MPQPARYLNPFTDFGFKKFLSAAEISKLSTEEARRYEDSLKVYRDIKNSLDTAREEGLEEGLEKGREEGLKEGIQKAKCEDALNMLADGLPVEKVSKYTGLPVDAVKKLQNNSSNKVSETSAKYKTRRKTPKSRKKS
jgi:predicted transposase/invertase (TIGR01784 family)